MRMLSMIIMMVLTYQIKAQDIEDVIAILNEPLQEEVQYTLDTMFNGQDTIFTETDSFILFTTPDMVLEEIDTLEYRYLTKTVHEWDHNEDNITDLIAVVFLADKRTKKHLDEKAKQKLVIATGIEDGTFSIDYKKNVIACASCGEGGRFPDVSFITDKNIVKLTEVRGKKQLILNDEYRLAYEEGKLFLENHASALFHQKTENFMTSVVSRESMMESREFEPAKGDKITTRVAIMPAEISKLITLDGKLDEKTWKKDYKQSWRPVHSTLFGEKHTMNDLFAKYSVAWNKSNIFIALNVKDEVLVPADFSGDEAKGDYIQLDFNFNKNKIAKGELMKAFPEKTQLSLLIGFDKEGKPTVKNLITGKAQEEVKVAFGRKVGKDGYTVEIQIPFKNLRAGTSIPFTVSLGDADNREDTAVQNIDTSSIMDEKIPFYLGAIELFRKFNRRTFANIKKN
ncbi:MAG: hypothetical protein ACI94Y_002552 [Maribacter sp.]|jgi:hypothetical protein